MEARTLKQRIKFLILFFICALAAAGLTAFPLIWEINLLYRFIGPGSFMEHTFPPMTQWISFIYQGLTETNQKYPFMLYGTDWLAFAHIVIAIAFIGPLRDPVRNIWVIEFGMIACVLIIPTVLIMGPIRGIPPFWQVVDSSFGVLGFIPLWFCRQYIVRLSELQSGMFSPALAQLEETLSEPGRG